ncbi:type I-E CRISPR-associated protein Cse1/CasA [Methanoregula sp.]|uniref:type I-E CRISPR-associated protein Cse1/CasA n=1 Tax=Methanoregula sp. TaxID=2052170 RepID=UPI003569ADE3
MFNLIQESWIPVIRQTGTRESIAPAGIVEKYSEDPVLDLDAPRPDFNGALVQFLIGLVQTTCPPATESEWRKKFSKPPTSEELQSAFGHYAHAFNLDGDGPRFMQDLDLSEKEGESNQIDHLLMEMPGAQTLDKNTDHFLKRDTVKQICISCCATALLTLQTNAPSGGRGHRTSVRGGGPLTTIVIGRTLWETIWLNVLTTDEFFRYGNAAKNTDPDLFPWMGPTRTSEKSGHDTTSQHVHPVQLFWGMPRRIRLGFENRPEKKPCDLCNRSDSRYVAQYLDKSYGINYKGGWRHPLTPYSIDEKTGEYLPKHGQSGGISYRNWLGLVQNAGEKKYRTEPAVVVHTFRQERQDALSGKNEIPFRLWAFGYDMNNMKACGWYEGTMPLIHLEPDVRPEYELVVSQMIKTASLIASNVRTCVKKALFSPKAEISLDKSLFESIDSRFWQDTEPRFYETLNDLKIALQTKQTVQELKLRWLAILSNEGEHLFDQYSQSSLISVVDPKRIALARRDFRVFSSANNKKIIELLMLDLPKLEKSRDLKTKDKQKKKT